MLVILIGTAVFLLMGFTFLIILSACKRAAIADQLDEALRSQEA